MSVVLSDDFFNMQFPAEALASSCDLPSRGSVFEAVALVWDFCEDRYWNGFRTNRAAAFHDAEAYLKDCTQIFLQHEKAYEFSDLERITALTAWLAPKGIDAWEQDEYWEILGPDVVYILTMMQLDDNAYILPSIAKDDRTLAFNIGLRTLAQLDHLTRIYRQKHRPLDNYISDPQADMRYAFGVLNDHPVLETPLIEACREGAKTLIDTLKGHCAYHRPVVVIDNRLE